MSKTKKNKSTRTAISPTAHQSKELKEHLRIMTVVWIGFTVAGLIVLILSVLQIDKVISFAKNNLAPSIAYGIIFTLWKVYRVKSRGKIVSEVQFKEKMSSDIAFARRFNNIELLKTTANYLLFSIPLLYATGYSKLILSALGYESIGFGGDLKNFFLSVVSTAWALLVGILGSYLYDKHKNKLP